LISEFSIVEPPNSADIFGCSDTAKHIYRGTHRVRALTETVELAWRTRAQAGISRVADITDLDTVGIAVFNTIRPWAARGSLTVTCGKGVDRLAALASALMEAVERHCGEQHNRRGVAGTLHDVARERKVLNPRALILDRNSSWTENHVIEWWPYRNLSTDDIVLLPAQATFSPYWSPYPRMTGSVTDGLAAGNSQAEATLHALYELTERDCSAFGQVLRMGHRVPLSSLPPEFSDLMERFHRSDLAVRVFSFSNDVGIPTFHVTLDDRQSGDPLLLNAGSGCHLSPQVALYRALTEAAQSRLSVISGGREDLARHSARRKSSYASARERADRWAQGWPPRPFADHPDLSTGSLGTDLRVLLRHLSDAGLGKIYLTDLSLPGFPFSVIRAVVPGLEFCHQETGRLGARMNAAIQRRAASDRAVTT
jgi:ribosomal protein S12 methylthiotransferase accessory factor